jgi:DNA end-binding protein Ku
MAFSRFPPHAENAMAARKGVITFGLVSIPVELHVAARPVGISANLLHAACQSRIRQQWMCPTCDRVVQRSELVRGYPADGGYVVLEDRELEQLEEASSRAIDVVEFVDAAEVNPLYMETSFYVTPQKDTERAYEVLLAALSEAKKAAVVRFVATGRQHYAVLRPDERVLVLHTLYYADEVRALEADWKRPAPRPEEVRLARDLIEALGKPFDPGRFQDEYRLRLAALIQAKAGGETVTLPAAPAAPARVVDLMEALRQSVEQVRKPPAKADAAPGAREAAGARARRAKGGRRGRAA